VIIDPQASGAEIGPADHLRAVDRDRYAVLTSGDAGSLLSCGLLDELDVECHPVFFSDSQQPQATSAKAYEALRREYPGTTLIRSNVGRLVATMLESVTFSKPSRLHGTEGDDLSGLWAASFFPLATLPLLHRRSIGRLIGTGTFDSTARARRHGIQHNGGRYERSRFFDRTLTRYFRSKGWRTTHFSLLRTLSDFLIEGILVECFPHLLPLRSACRGPRGWGDGINPCGICEACRGVVAMLLALDADPSICGYREAQVEAALAACDREGIRLDRATTEHLAHLLYARGTIPSPRLGTVAGHEHSEIEKVRLDDERSPLSDIPMSLRLPLLDVFLDHSDGALFYTGCEWIDVDGSDLELMATGKTPFLRPRRTLT
jgi:hypothetical protein